MKKFVSAIAALAACVLLLSGCDKHAYSISTNVFKIVTGDSVTTMGQSTSMEVGDVFYVYAASSSGSRLTGGQYTFNTENTSSVFKASVSTYEGESCVKVEAVGSGSGSITINFLWEGFKLYKSISVNVQ